MSPDEARKVLDEADLLVDEASVDAAIRRMAGELTARLENSNPLVLVVMCGAVYVAGRLLGQLRFPLEVDYIHATRYGAATTGGQIAWKVSPPEAVRGRSVLVVDDILDGGDTLADIRSRLLALGASEVLCAVLTDKELGRAKPIRADFVGLSLPDRYVFGCGMDVSGAWRNLPAIYALKGH